MIKRILLLALIPLLLLTSSPVSADDGITVLDSSVEVQFPVALVFSLEVESDADIIDVRLHYEVDRMNYTKVISEGWPDFAPASRVETSWTWDMRKSSLPSGAAITYWWTVKDAEGREGRTVPGTVQFDDLRYRWQSLTEGELTIFWYEEDKTFAQELMDACQQGLIRLTGSVGMYDEKPIRIYIYASASDLQGAMIFPQEWTGGVAFTEFGIIAIGISSDNVDWGKEALVHELTHLVVHQATFSPYGRLPTWLDEGLAMCNQGELTPSLRARLEEAVSENRLISVRSLCSPFSAEPEKAFLSYAESYSLVEFLLANYGQDKMLNLLTIFREGSTYDEALTEVYGFDIDGFDAIWRETLALPSTAFASEGEQSHPALFAVLSSIATLLKLPSTLHWEEWEWGWLCNNAMNWF